MSEGRPRWRRPRPVCATRGWRRSIRPARSRPCKRRRCCAKALGVKRKKIERLQNLNQGLWQGMLRGRRSPQAAQGVSPMAGAAGERLPARRRDAGRGRRAGPCAPDQAVEAAQGRGIGLVLPEPLLSLARCLRARRTGRFVEGHHGHERFEVTRSAEMKIRERPSLVRCPSWHATAIDN